jgi:hypothetical protein
MPLMSRSQGDRPAGGVRRGRLPGLMGDGAVRRLVQEDQGSTLSVVADVLGIIMAVIGLWELAARFDIVSGRSPSEITRDAFDPGRGSTFPSPTIPTLPTIGEPMTLNAPANVQVSGGCDQFTLTWDPVDGAERYVIERDGFGTGTTTETEFKFQLFPDGMTHDFRVRAAAFPAQSEPSESVEVGPCSF